MDPVSPPPGYFDPPEEIVHRKDCPLYNPKPWRPSKCICEDLHGQDIEDRADAERKGE